MRELLLYQDHDGDWICESKDVPGLRVKGKTQEEAIERIKTAIRLYDPCRCED